MSKQLAEAVQADFIFPGSVFFQDRLRAACISGSEIALFDLGMAHPDVFSFFASAHSSENTASTSALVGVLNTLCAITRAVCKRSYVVAAAMTSESGKLAASISSTLPSNAVLVSFIVMGALEVVEINWELTSEGGAA